MTHDPNPRWIGPAIALLAIASVLATAPVSAATARDPEHRRIADERAAANTAFAEHERVCMRQFVVTSCMEAARREQRAILSRLHREELALNEAQRREAAEARRREVAEKLNAQAARTGAETGAGAGAGAAAPPLHDGTRRWPLPNPGPSPTSANPPRGASASRESEATRQAVEARHEADFEAKTRATEAHREAVERRNADRAAAGKAAKPLPVPNSASAAGPSAASR